MFYDLVLQKLNEKEVKYLIVGGLAVNLHGVPRFTKDLDIIIEMTPQNIKRLIEVMKELGYRPKVPVRLEQFISPVNRKKWQEEKQMKAFNLICLDKPYEEIDIVINTPLKFKTAYQKREEIKAGKLLLPLINLDNLIKMKKFSARKQDISDIESLQKVKRVKGNEGKIKEKRI